jgi:ABC-type branched-subunit amino acid transport system substrate-binding protein
MASIRRSARGAKLRRLVVRFLPVVVTGVAGLASSCGGRGGPPRIVYPDPWLGSALARVAQEAIDAWGRPRVAEIPDSLMRSITPRQGLAGEVDYAVAMAAVPRVAVAVGPPSSRATLLAAPIYAERGIPVISPTATSHRLGDLEPRVFALAPDGETEGEFMARFIVDRLGARRVTVFYLVADEYGLDLRTGVVQALGRRGVALVDEVGIIDSTDFPRRVAQSLRRATPEAVVVAARAREAIAIWRVLHDHLPSVPVVVGDGAPLNAPFTAASGDAAENVYGVTWWHRDRADSASRAFAARFERIARKPPSAADAMNYDAIMLAAQAVRDVGSDGGAIQRYLGELGETRPPYDGITGAIAFGPGRTVNLVMTRLDHGAVVIVNDPGRER